MLAVAGVITMVALSPRAEGFYPTLFDFVKVGVGVRVPQKIETKTIVVPTADEVKTNQTNE